MVAETIHPKCVCGGGGRGGDGGGRAIGPYDLKMQLENGRADERVSRGQASERAVCVCELVSVEKGTRRPPLLTVCVCLLLQDLVQSCLRGGGGDMGGHVLREMTVV